MRRIILYSVIGIVGLGGVFGFAHSARAEELTPAQITAIAAGEGTSEQEVRQNILDDPGYWESLYRSTYVPPTQTERQEQEERAAAARERAAKEKEQAERDKQQDPLEKLKCFYPHNVLRCAAQPVANMALWIAARFLWIAGILLNMSIHYTLNMSMLLENLPIVDIGWKIIRDIANIVFIFIALWSGTSIILGIRAEKAWGLLAHMVLVALFINFSLFITKAVVDASNVAALHFYSLIKQPPDPKKEPWDGGLSDAFMAGINIQSLYDTRQLAALTAGDQSNYVQSIGNITANEKLSVVNIILIGVFGSLFMIVAAWVFFAAAIMFIIRAVVLIMLMILSPLAFVAWLLPGAAGLASAWWSKLWSQSFFAPLYLALAYVVVATINAPTFRGIAALGPATTSKTGTYAAAFTGFNSASVIIVFNFIILIGLMVGCLIIAQSLGARGSEMAMKGWGKIKAMGMGAVGGAAGILARTGLRAGEALASTDFMKKRFKDRPEVLQKMKKWSVRNLDERWREAGGMLGGQSAIGKFLREKTTGRLVQAEIAGKSIEKAHLESKEMETKRRDIALRHQALEGGAEMDGLTPEMQKKQRRQELLKDVKDNAQVIVDKYRADRDAGIPPTEEEIEKQKLAAEHLASPKALDDELETLETRLAELTTEYKKAQSKMETALSRMSTGGFLSMPTEHFFNKNMVDVRVLGLDKYLALKHSEGILSHEEKEKVNEARYGAMHEESGRVDKSVKEWYDRQPQYLKLREKHQADLQEYEEKNKKWEGDNAAYVTAQQTYETKKAEREKVVQQRTKAEQTHEEAKQTYERKKTEYLSKGYDPRLMEAQIGKPPPVAPTLPELPPEPKAPPAPAIPKPEAPPTPNIPGMPGFQGEWRRTLRNMLNLEEFESINEFYPGLYESKHWTATVRQGLINRIRESKNFTNQEKEKVRENKSYPIRMMSDNRIGEDFYEMEALPAAEKEKRRKDSEKEFRQDPKAFLDTLRQDPKKQNRHQIGMWRLGEMIGGKNQEEVAMMPGRFLFTPQVAMLIDRGKANSAPMRGKDEGEKVELLEIVLPFEDAFLRGEITEEYFTPAMQDFLDWWRHNTRGQEWYSQSVELPIHKNVYARQPDGTLKVVESKVMKNVTRDTNDPGAGYRWVNIPGKGVQKIKMEDKAKMDDEEFEEKYGFKPPWSA